MNRFLHVCVPFIFVVLLSSGACSKDDTGGGPDSPGADTEVNHMMDQLLGERYLWNDEYIILSPDFSLPYDKFLKETLLGMKTNTLDKKERNGSYQLYSYVQRRPLSSRASVMADIDDEIQKETTYNFGICALGIVAYYDPYTGQALGEYGLVVRAVYPDSPMAKAGIKRGAILNEVNGSVITDQNLSSIYSLIVYPEQARTLSLTVSTPWGVYTREVSSELMYSNPVLYSEIITRGDHKVGYLVYSGFDAAYDRELLDVLQKFKSANINDLILDLRLNGGGYVMSSRMLASCIAGAQCEDKVFQYYRYNDTRMADPETTSMETGQAYDEASKRFYEKFIYGDYRGVDLRQYALNLSRLYVITSGNTASASEAVIGSLRGIDIPVKLVGKRTNGKNVGMEGAYLKAAGYEYILYPITFQIYDAQLETVDPAGIAVDFGAEEWKNGLGDFGSMSDPCLAQAMALITGNPEVSVMPRGMNALPMEFIRDIPLPEVPGRPEGMILLPPRVAPKN